MLGYSVAWLAGLPRLRVDLPCEPCRLKLFVQSYPSSTVYSTVHNPISIARLSESRLLPEAGLFVSPIPFSGRTQLHILLVLPLFSPLPTRRPPPLRRLLVASSFFLLPDKIFDLANFVGQKVALYHAFRAVITSFDPPGLAVMRLGTDSPPKYLIPNYLVHSTTCSPYW